MKKTTEELLHHPEGGKEWFELFSFNFSDKKSKIYGSAEVEVLPKKKKILLHWDIFADGVQYSENEAIDFDGDFSTKKFVGHIMKCTMVVPGEKYKLDLKNSQIHAEIEVSSLFGVYDYPIAPDKEGSAEKHRYEELMWNRLEQRCKFSGTVKYKGKNKAPVSKKVDCFGQREKHWGEKLFDKVNGFSRYMIQFRDMSFSLTTVHFGEVALSSGFMSKKSGNIPIDEAELEHIDLASDRLPVITEISYKDSQDDQDLIVSNRLYSVQGDPVTIGKKSFYRFKNFSEYTIVGAVKKGLGMEEHYLTREFLSRITSDK